MLRWGVIKLISCLLVRELEKTVCKREGGFVTVIKYRISNLSLKVQHLVMYTFPTDLRKLAI